MLQVRVKILYNKKIKGNYFYLVLRAPKIAKESLPGQFLNIKVNDTYEPLLRRPVSIHIVKGANIELLYEVVGKATEILSRRKTGEYLDVIGPLGNGFNYPLSAIRYPLSVLVAGGMGIAPLIFLAEKLLKPRVSRHKLEVVVLIGAKTKDQILCEKELKNLGCEVKIATDDGSKGFKGYASELLKEVLSTIDYRLSTIYACGPKPMLKEIAKISKKHTIPAQLSLEEHMACGIGACLGCVVNTKEGFKRVCKEGPVFDGDGIIW
ncbi:MAG: dihydroorotate dehydrogenase electron transfer subunit [Candidatus Omnitrophota bacterium]|nr:dihydroorotate dehydrogenase electron transfer subunit [Candidatus Omnitrophota bacterium]